MNISPHPNILVGFDFSKSATRALRMAINLCGLLPRVHFHLVAALDHSDYDDASKVHERLRALADRLPRMFPMGNGNIDVYARIGDPAEVITDLADEIQADLVVIGDHEESTIKEALLGSTAEKVFRVSRAPVLCARPTHYDQDTPAIELEPAGPPTISTKEPHVYSYDQKIAPTRPDEWPLY
jgi:nucleotide-binding universal stress UspA family protein